MRTPAPGNRLIVGDSGVVFEVTAAVASGLVGNKSARYVDEAVTAPAAPSRPVRVEPESAHEPVPEPVVQQPALAVPKRRGRPPKSQATEPEVPEPQEP